MPGFPRALAFDLDGTLWSCDDVIRRAERALHAWLGAHYPGIPAEFDREAMRVVRRDLMNRRPELGADVTALRRASLEWHARRAGYDPALAAEGVAVFLAERRRVTPYPDVRPALERLAVDYPLVALTNGNADVWRSDLADLFGHFLTAAEVGAAKPDPALFRAACERLGLRAAEVVHIGDDPIRDIHAARAFGMPAVWINRTGAEWPEGARRPQGEIADLAGLPAALAGLG
ncbi:MAG TPA: HAD family hydrolase [Gammaproteobacteria bacterium]|nr:HAD family hydrolase [Gammaproteobacteria bacterium]